MPLPSQNHPYPSSAVPPNQRRSFFGKVFRGTGWFAAAPLAWAGAHRIRRGWSLIGDLLALLRAAPSRDRRFKTEDGDVFDLRATASSYEMSVHHLEARLAARQRQTARVAYTAFTLGSFFLLAWLWQALSLSWTVARLSSALYFLPFCALFFVVAFYNALLNFQIRSGRLASWYDYLTTSEAFWPK